MNDIGTVNWESYNTLNIELYLVLYLTNVHHRADFCTASYHSALFVEGNYKINIQQHLDIVNALLSKEFVKAKEYLKSHLENSQEVICKAIKTSKLCKI